MLAYFGRLSKVAGVCLLAPRMGSHCCVGRPHEVTRVNLNCCQWCKAALLFTFSRQIHETSTVSSTSKCDLQNVVRCRWFGALWRKQSRLVSSTYQGDGGQAAARLDALLILCCVGWAWANKTNHHWYEEKHMDLSSAPRNSFWHCKAVSRWVLPQRYVLSFLLKFWGRHQLNQLCRDAQRGDEVPGEPSSRCLDHFSPKRSNATTLWTHFKVENTGHLSLTTDFSGKMMPAFLCNKNGRCRSNC